MWTDTSLRIIVVDDNIDAAETLSMLLELNGHILETAHDGFEAVKLARAFKPQVGFLDIGMPGIDGYQTAAEIRRTPGLENIVLVAITGWAAESDRLKDSNTGFNYHFTKPVKVEVINDFLATINIVN